jgi:hypothetical protein
MRPSYAALALTSLLATACPSVRDRPPGNPRPSTGGNCGNTRIDTGETCDRAIAQGLPGACPTACSDGNACTNDVLTGAAMTCNVACTSTPIANCANGDGCCPEGCSNANDDDCSASCGNGTIDANETCDGNCPVSCNDGLACTADLATGSIASCSYSCAYAPVTPCTAGDGCCPAGCAGMDSDCSATCNNGTVDSGETCDGNCPTSCDDGNACTVDIVTGSAATCNVACARQAVTECNDGDGCCPAGCAGEDADCSTTCGNGTIDSGETCDGLDCPTECPPTECEVTTYVGSPATCNAACITTEITACTGGDGCCPSQCSMETDSDCTGGPAGDLGDPCTQPSECSDPGAPFSVFCLTTFPDGYCTTFCVENACPTGSRCALDFDGLCVKECATGADCRTPDYECRPLFDPSEQTFLGCAPPGN